MMDDSNYLQIFSDTIEHVLQPEETKDSLILLKQKTCKTNDLIKQYTEKIKDTERLKLDLETIKKDHKHMKSNYKSVMDKTKELELNITKVKQENNQLESKIKEYETFAAADKQNILQLTCKIKEMEDEHCTKVLEFDLQKSCFEDKIKKLKHELKIKKAGIKRKENNIVTTDNNITEPGMEAKSSSDIGINVSLDDIKLNTKPEVQEKNIMTDEFYHLKDDPYPVFCAKCTTHVYPPPIKKICQIMSACPDLYELIFSPELICPLSPLSEKSACSDKNIVDKELEYADKDIPDKQQQHSFKNVLDKKQEHSDMNVPDKKLEYSNRNVLNEESRCSDRNKMASTSKVSSPSHLLIPIDCSSVDDTHNVQFESKDSATAQNFVNLKFKDEDYTKYKPVTTNLSSDPGLILKHSSSIKNMGKAIQALKRKTKKQLQKMKKKINKKHCCHHAVTSCNSVTATSAATNAAISLNSDLLVSICKGMIELIDNQKKILSKKEDKKKQNAKSKKYKCSKKKMKLKRLNDRRGEFSWKVEHLHKSASQDTVFTNSENILPVIDQSLITETIINQSDLSDKTFSVHSTEGKSVAEVKPVTEVESVAKVKPVTVVESVAKVNPVTEVESIAKVKPVTEVESVAKVKSVIEVESVAKEKSIREESIAKMKPVVDSLMTLYSSTDEIFVSNSSSIDNVESINSSYHTATEMTLSPPCNELSINRSDDNIVNTITVRNRSQNKEKFKGQLLLKKCRNLKRKMRMNSSVHSNKQLEIKLCSKDISEFYEPVRKRRIAHTSKTASQPNFERNSIHRIVRSVVESKVFVNPPANIQTPKDGTSIEIKTNCTVSDKRDKDNLVKSTSTHRYKEPSIKKNLSFTKTDFIDNNNIASLVNNIEQVSSVNTALGSNNGLINLSTFNGTTSTEKTTIRTFNNELEVSHNNILRNTTSNEESNRYASSNIFCEDSKNYKLTEDTHANTTEVMNNTSQCVMLYHLPVIPILKSTNKSCNYKSDEVKDTHDEVSEKRSIESQPSNIQVQGDSLSVNSEENCATSKECDKQSAVRHIETQDIDRKSVKEEYLYSPPLKRRNITENYVNDNMARKSHDEVNIGTEKKEVHINNERTGTLDFNISEWIEKCIKVTYADDDDDNDENYKNNMKQYNDIKINDIKDDIKDDGIKDNDIKNNDNTMDNDIKNNDNIMDNKDNDDGRILTPKDQLYKYINNNFRRGIKMLTCKNKRKARKNLVYVGTFVTRQLTRLMQDKNWKNCVHDDVVEKLTKICGPRFIAKCIIDFLAQHSDSNRVVDKSFTPPAPLMSRCEQKIVTLLIDLERLRPTIIFMRAGIQYKLFKLNSNLKYTEADTFTRVYVALARLQNDREAVRIMCCDALYCLGFRAINVIYVALTSWPEIFPLANASKELLPKCIAFLVLQLSNTTYQKLLPLKMLITKYYQYTQQDTMLQDIVNELMSALADKPQDGLNTAVILVAKRNGPVWAYENIIKAPLLPMIIRRRYPCMYSAFCLLGKLLRSFPLDSSEVSVKDISKQLVDLLESGEFSDSEQEGVASALLNLSRQEFDKVTMAVIKWTPKNSLRPNTIAQIEAHIKTHTPKYWKTFIAKRKLFNEKKIK